MKNLIFIISFIITILSFAFCAITQPVNVSDSKYVDNGGRGMFKSVVVSDDNMRDYTIYRPEDLKRVKAQKGTVPLFIFANGRCNDTSVPYERFLSEVASHGYIVIAHGAFQYELHDRIIQTTPHNMIPKAIDRMLSLNADKNSEYYNIISVDKIAVGGHSCGGADALSTATDPRIKTYLLFNSGIGDMSMFGATPESVSKIHAPVIYIAGGPSDIAYPNAMMDYERISDVPVVFANFHEAGHSGTFDKEFGGSFSEMTIDWLDFIFGNDDKRSLFTEEITDEYPGWTLLSRNFKKEHVKKSSDLNNSRIDPVRVSGIDSVLKSLVDQCKINSVAAFVAKSGDIVYNNSYGYKDIEKNKKASVDDYYVMFSQTKAVTTVAFMTLVERGLVAVNDPVSKYLPGISDQVVLSVNEDGTYTTRPVSTPMTFAHLMSHSSGLNAGLVKDIIQKERMLKKAVDIGKSIAQTGLLNKWTLASYMERLLPYPLGFDPGSQWDYHISTDMLGYLIEIISGMSLRDYTKQYVLEPLEMDETDWYFPSDKASRFVKTYNYENGILSPFRISYSDNVIGDDYSYCQGAAGLSGPIGDYAKFCQMLLNKGEFRERRILKPETVELMTTVNQLPEDNHGGWGFKFGLGFELFNEKKRPVPQVSTTAYAWGGMLGTEYIIDPENDLIALFYLNMSKRDFVYPLFLEQVYETFK